MLALGHGGGLGFFLATLRAPQSGVDLEPARLSETA